MGVYIKGMEMPKDGEKLYMIAFSDGKACASYKPFEWHEVVPVPPHGRLCDLDAVSLEDGPYEDDEWYKWALDQYQDAPIIIPADDLKEE